MLEHAVEKLAVADRTQVVAPRLSGLQALRGIAAIAVVFTHAARHVDRALGAPLLIGLFQPGHAGVDLFFVISGFIIMHTHGRDIGRPASLRRYAARRFTRVMPLYWVGLALGLALSLAAGHGLPEGGRLLRLVTLTASPADPLLGIAWTLQLEMVFYLVFALLIIRRALGMVALALWLAWIGTTAAGVTIGASPAAAASVYCLEFFVGMAVARLSARPSLPMRAVLWGGIAAFAATYALEGAGLLDGYTDAARIPDALASGAVVLGVTRADIAGRSATPRWLQALGTASYSIYLFQFTFIAVAWQICRAAGLVSPAACFAALAAAGVAGGWAMSRLVEHPLLGLIRQRPGPAIRPAVLP